MDIYVYLDMAGPIQKGGGGAQRLLGVLHSDIVRGKEVFSFTGGDEWLLYREFQVLDPNLGPFQGRQYPRENRPNFGLFMDSAPDRWGRMLIKRRESMATRLEGRAPRTLHETDFLLGVYDGSRMGALRLKLDPEGDFLDNNREAAIPPWASLRNLEYASMRLEREDSADEKDYMQWLNLLLKPGSSLGGARPKATAADRDGHLWIAKFPSVNDTKDTGAWERVVNELAADCGITVPESRAQRFSNRHHSFLAKRFDRTTEGRRLHFASAMTLLDRQDGDDHSAGASYLDIAGIITRSGADVNRNLEELWRRMVFNIAVSNCDDHLRNHGFLLTAAGWVLSPAYDMNPDENGAGLTLNITETDNALDFDLPMDIISYFRLKEEKALAILAEVKHSVSNWRTLANKYGIPKIQQDMAEAAFRVGT